MACLSKFIRYINPLRLSINVKYMMAIMNVKVK